MAWARIDDGFHDHPKVDELSLAAVGLWTLCLTWAHRHRKTAIIQGHITEARVRKLAGKQAESLATELMAAGLWEPESGLGGYVIHDFADYMPKPRDPDELRESGRRGAAKRWQGDGKPDGNLPSEGMANDGSRASAPASPSRPVPVGTSVEGERPETLRAVPATDPAPKGEPTCAKHPHGNPDDSPCAGCAKVREHRDRAEARETDRRTRDLEQRRNACTRCDGVWVITDDGKLTNHKCDHRRAS